MHRFSSEWLERVCKVERPLLNLDICRRDDRRPQKWKWENFTQFFFGLRDYHPNHPPLNGFETGAVRVPFRTRTALSTSQFDHHRK
ncbi:hypothetical protein V1294_003320 [Bradyrhizobium sp. AZCC 1678]|uniref:hypothetical protein n=1 Tax=Bradyrhizobium sp. AZCC 1678 TaxID=3117030 RepID=UPI002FF2595C